MHTMPADVQAAFAQAPQTLEEPLLQLRELVFDVINCEDIAFIEETLKWGEPSYLAKHGSTLRISWSKNGAQYGLYFHCQTKLVDTFRLIYGDLFHYAGNRAILFNHDDAIPVAELKQCIVAALRYHQIKHLHHLGL